MGVEDHSEPEDGWLRRWGVLIGLGSLALLLNGLHGYLEYAASTHGDSVPWNVEWARSTAENLQSEVWQIAFAVAAVDSAIAVWFWFRAKSQ